MRFREWINEDFDVVAQDVNTFLLRVRAYVLKRFTPDDSSLHFPPNYDIFFPEEKGLNKTQNRLKYAAGVIGQIFELNILGRSDNHQVYKKLEKIAGHSHAKNWLEIIRHHAEGLVENIRFKEENG